MVALTKRRARPGPVKQETPTTSSPKRKRRNVHAEMEDSILRTKRSRVQTVPYQAPETIRKLTDASMSSLLSKVAATKTSAKHQIKTPPATKATLKGIIAAAIKRKSSRQSTLKTPVTNNRQTKEGKSMSAKGSVKSANETPKRKSKQVISRKIEDKGSPKTSPKVAVVVGARKEVSAAKKRASKKAKVVSQEDSGIDEEEPQVQTPKRKQAKKVKDADDGDKKVAEKGKKPKKRGKNALDPKPHVTVFEKDPTFESRMSIPTISTLADSRLLIRAVLLEDNKLLESYLKKDKWICSKAMPRSLADPTTALIYAFRRGNVAAIKLLLDNTTYKSSLLAGKPGLMLRGDSTGRGSHMMFGHALRAVTVGRGGKEGNGAFLKDESWYGYHLSTENSMSDEVLKIALRAGLDFETLKTLQTPTDYSSIISDACDSVVHAIQGGHVELAWRIMKEGNERGGFGFNNLHEQVLNPNNEPLAPFKAVSVVKKATGNSRLTPLHCAAINPNTSYLSSLLGVRPEVNVNDTENWNLLHYAAVATSRKPLDFLLSRGGLSTLSVNKKGNTPLHLACDLGRFESVQAILEHELASSEEKNGPGDGEAEEVSPAQKLSSTSLVLKNKEGLTPVQVAAKWGHTEILRRMLTIPGVDVNKPTPAQNEKLTFLMLAAQHGHLDLVKYLTEERESLGLKLELGDRRGRSALALAVLNGQTHVVSYLLRLGMNHLTRDSSGNTLLHYAAAYGWYFICKLLMEAGCPINETNQWKLTPVAAAFMKGHTGIVQMFLEHDEVDINSPVNYDTGMTLLHETCTTEPSQSLLDRIILLVDELKADCNVVDYKGNNALHLMVYSYAQQMSRHYPSTPFECTTTHSFLVNATKLLLQRGCDPQALNHDKVSPTTLAVQKGCFVLLTTTLYKNESEVEVPRLKDREDNNVLHSMVSYAEKASTETFYRMLGKKPENVEKLQEMAREKNKLGQTPLLRLLADYQSSYEDDYPNQRKEKKQKLTLLQKFCRFLIKELKSSVNEVVEREGHRSTALHLACISDNGKNFLQILLDEKPDLEVTDWNGNTPLTSAVLKGTSGLVEQLIKAGADIQALVYRKKDDDNPRSILLTVAEHGLGGNYDKIPYLIQQGANVFTVDKNGSSSLHHICGSPTVPGALGAVKALLGAGYPGNSVNKEGRTPLHLCVNSRGGQTDVFYDIEDALIEAAPNALSMWDVRGRVPLHYAFVKSGNFKDASCIDPIELTALLVNAMKESKYTEEIGFVDAFGATPLHYAAARGAIISSSLLFGDNIAALNLKDNEGNTPFGLAVLNSHQTCALHFQQKKADFAVSINKRRGSPSPTTDEQRRLESSPWEWNKSRLEREENEKTRVRSDVITILQQVVSYEWQGILYLMVESLRESGKEISPAVHAAITTNRLKLAQKLLLRVRSSKELAIDGKEGTLLHVLAKKAGNAVDEKNVLDLLLSKGVDVMAKDEHGTNPIIYAAINRNHALCELLSFAIRKGSGGNLLGQDRMGRNVFAAAFWDLKSNVLSKEMKKWLNGYEGITGNVVSSFPMKLSQLPTVRYLCTSEVPLEEDDSKFSPLISAVVYQNYDAVKWLLSGSTTKSLLVGCKVRIDVNFQDAMGRTALMHAVRLNDIKMVKLLLNPRHYEPNDDNVPWKEAAFPVTDPGIDFSLKDKNGFTVFHHILKPSELPFSYAHGVLILKLLKKARANLSDVSVTQLANTLNRFHLGQALSNLQGTAHNKAGSKETILYPDFPRVVAGQLEVDSKNVREDAKSMAARINENKETDLSHIRPDSLIGHEAKEYEVVFENGQPFDLVMTKVDLNYGMFGLYNFYKMQVLQQPKGKGMILLFTRWGRVGDDGQYQKTPFGSLEEATKEFRKIFRSKSGNAWEELSSFKPLPNKYRLVNKALSAKRPNEVKVDFDALEKIAGEKESALPKEVRGLVRHLSIAHRSGNLHEYGGHMQLPFGIVSREALVKGEEILEKIQKLIDDKEKLTSAVSHSKDEEQKLMNGIVEASEEFYAVVPVHGFKTERLSPMFESSDIRQKQEMIQSILHLEFATELLLASQFNSSQHNPMDYIYSCLNTKIQLLTRDEFETQMILQYIHNTGSHSPTIHNIYRVEREGESAGVPSSSGGDENRCLLWHGTRSVNLLSILSRGLQIAPLGTALNGHLFGKGLYFADMFAKSQKYTGGGGGSRQFLLLCEVALGKVCSVDLNTMDDDFKGLPSGYDSLKTDDSRYVPDPGATIHWQNRAVPLGKRTTPILEKVNGKERYYGLDYNEYIVFNSKQVSIKYVVEFTN